MSEGYRVSNVDEAVALATEFKDQGKYNWFRGQTKPWPPYSSALRIKLKGEQNFEEAIQAPLLRFSRWVEIIPSMEPFLHDVNAVFAVAQHYGMSTDYIDFTTDPAVAGFFACDTSKPVPGTYSGYPGSPTREDIYPKRKSSLEILLDQYFMSEELLRGNKQLREMYDSLQYTNKAWLTFEQHPDNTHAKFFVGGSVPPLLSWNAEQLKPWLLFRTETMVETEARLVRVAVDATRHGSHQ